MVLPPAWHPLSAGARGQLSPNSRPAATEWYLTSWYFDSHCIAHSISSLRDWHSRAPFWQCLFRRYNWKCFSTDYSRHGEFISTLQPLIASDHVNPVLSSDNWPRVYTHRRRSWFIVTTVAHVVCRRERNDRWRRLLPSGRSAPKTSGNTTSTWRSKRWTRSGRRREPVRRSSAPGFQPSMTPLVISRESSTPTHPVLDQCHRTVETNGPGQGRAAQIPARHQLITVEAAFHSRPLRWPTPLRRYIHIRLLLTALVRTQGCVHDIHCVQKKHPLAFSFISLWMMCGFKQKCSEYTQGKVDSVLTM